MRVIVIKLLMISNYNPTNPERIHPAFRGIAHKSSDYKKKRLSLEHRRNSLLQNLNYKLRVDRQLDQNLTQKRQKLKTVVCVHSRHLHDQQQKRQLSEQKKRQLIERNKTVQFTKEQNQKNVKYAVLSNIDNKRKQRQQQINRLQNLHEQMRMTQMSVFQEKRTKYKEVKHRRRLCTNTVNQFFRQKNKQSVLNYAQDIQKQAQKAAIYEEDIRYMSQCINKCQQSIQKKKKDLYNIMDQISLYTYESTESQSKCLPLYLKESTSASSYSSRPKDLLLKGIQTAKQEKKSFWKNKIDD